MEQFTNIIDKYPNDATEDEQLSWLTKHYHFYIMNDGYVPQFGYELWVKPEDHDFPVIQSNSLGRTSFSSFSLDVGTAIKPTQEFFELIEAGFTEKAKFERSEFYSGEFDIIVDMIYNDKDRHHEVWAASELIEWMFNGEHWIPELAPIVYWVNQSTSFEIPVMKLQIP